MGLKGRPPILGTFNSILYNAYATANIKLNIMQGHILTSSNALRSWDRRDTGTKMHEEAHYDPGTAVRDLGQQWHHLHPLRSWDRRGLKGRHPPLLTYDPGAASGAAGMVTDARRKD